jgi:hypothetical protein
MRKISESLLELNEFKGDLGVVLSSEGIEVPSLFSEYASEIINFNNNISIQLQSLVLRGGNIIIPEGDFVVYSNGVLLSKETINYLQKFYLSITNSTEITSYEASLVRESTGESIPVATYLPTPYALLMYLMGETLNIGEEYLVTISLNGFQSQYNFIYTGQVIVSPLEQFYIPVDTVITFQLPDGDTYQTEGVTLSLWADVYTEITGAITYNEERTIATFTPDQPFPYNTEIGTQQNYLLTGNLYSYVGYIWFLTEQEGGSI